MMVAFQAWHDRGLYDRGIACGTMPHFMPGFALLYGAEGIEPACAVRALFVNNTVTAAA